MKSTRTTADWDITQATDEEYFDSRSINFFRSFVTTANKLVLMLICNLRSIVEYRKCYVIRFGMINLTLTVFWDLSNYMKLLNFRVNNLHQLILSIIQRKPSNLYPTMTTWSKISSKNFKIFLTTFSIRGETKFNSENDNINILKRKVVYFPPIISDLWFLKST